MARHGKMAKQGISIHAPRTGSDSSLALPPPKTAHFNPRSPHGERREQYATVSYVDDFNPRSPHGERPDVTMCAPFSRSNFNPRSPHGARLHMSSNSSQDFIFQSTLPARGATRFWCIYFDDFDISIHAPRTGSDEVQRASRHRLYHFNPRSPHGERLYLLAFASWYQEFQSTLPARGATSTAD